jgi:hypothetical protein
MARLSLLAQLDVTALSSSPAPLRARRTSCSDIRLRSGLMRIERSRVPQIWQSNAHNFRHCLSAMPRREQSGHDWNATCAVIRASVWVIVPKVRDCTVSAATRAAIDIFSAVVAATSTSKSSMATCRVSTPICARSSSTSQWLATASRVSHPESSSSARGVTVFGNGRCFKLRPSRAVAGFSHGATKRASILRLHRR